MTLALPSITVPSTIAASRRRLLRHGEPVWSVGLGALRRFAGRHRLTAQERAHLTTTYIDYRPAVFTASLGGCSFLPGRW